MRIELRQVDSDSLLDALEVADLAEVPHPGRWFHHGDRSFLVLQRRHRYRLRDGRYRLAAIALDVRPQQRPADARWWQGRWVIGDPACRFNARSPLLRCAVLPEGPCDRCVHFSPCQGGASASAAVLTD
jgi:hypothetical protein